MKVLSTNRLLCLSAASFLLFIHSPGALAQQVTSFTLIDASSDVAIGPLSDGDVLDLSALPGEIAVRANTSPAAVGSVRFGYQGNPSYRLENVAPYALEGDSRGDYDPWEPSPGSVALSATAFSEEGANGSAGPTLSINFEVVSGAGSSGSSMPPTNLSLTPVSATELLLAWDQPAEGSDYRIQYATNPNFSGAVSDFLYFGYDEFAYDDLLPGTTYYFRIRTSVQGDLSPWSETVSATTLGSNGGGGGGDATVSGELRKWHTVTLDFDGPTHSETDVSPNPFLDYRLDVTFRHVTSGASYVVPGYFAADGNAAQTSASRGSVWRVHFTPDRTGAWTYEVSFRTGSGVAVANSPSAGSTVAPVHGSSGEFAIGNSDKSGRDFRGKGRLSYVGEHYLRFEGTGEYFVKGGPDAPENFLAYDDFDNTPNNGGRRKSWAPHAGDYRAGDPTWQGGKGSEMIGALNYLASEGMNAFSFLTMNINGDDRNVYPYVTDDDFTHFDVSKLDQWDVVFSHAQARGLYLHFKTQETENDGLLDDGALGTERKLYYRMLIAHFGHHLALNWNLGEENTNSSDERKAFAQYLRDVDPYDHHIVVHTYPNAQESVYEPLLGSASALTGASIQIGWNRVYEETKQWVEASAAAGKPWVVANDEQNSANVGVPPFVGYVDPSNGDTFDGTSVDHDDIRRETLWGNLMAGGAGVEYYFGYQLPQGDLTAQDYRSRDGMWDYTRYAIEFFGENVPVASMKPANDLASDGRVLADDGGEVYVVQLPTGGSASLTLPPGRYTRRWFNPRSGAFAGPTATITGGSSRSLGNPPNATASDWVALLQRTGTSPTAPPPSVETIAINAGGGAYTAGDGTAYQADDYFSGGNTFTAQASIAGTTDDPLFRSERYGGNLRYDVPVANGDYRVTLRFAEVFFTATAKRVFDVRLEGALVTDDLDLYATVGHDVAYDLVETVTVADGTLDIDLAASVNNAKLSAVLIEPTAAFAATAARREDRLTNRTAVERGTFVFPNPTSDVVVIGGQPVTRATVLDMSGRVLQQHVGDARQLDLSDYPPGSYFVELVTASGTDRHRVLKD